MQKLKQHWNKKSKSEKISFLLILAGLLLVLYYLIVNWLPKWYRQFTYIENLDMVANDSSAYRPVPILLPDDVYYRFTYPTDSLFTTEERTSYQSGDLLLRVPRLGYEGTVVDGTTDANLKKGPGLYKNSALPSFGNPNVCIAAHRGVYGAEFYYIDKITTGDQIYLEYDNYLFTYDYVETVVVPADDWSLMYCTDYSAITLSSCQLTNSTERICVRGKLRSVTPLLGAEPIVDSASSGSSSDSAASQTSSSVAASSAPVSDAMSH